MSREEAISVSVVVPVYNASATLRELCGRLVSALSPVHPRHEILLVDDGSRDGSWQLIEDLSAVHESVTGIRLARNFGQTAAWCAGIEASSGEIVATIDADLDTYPEDIVLLVDAVQAGAEVANGARQDRHWRRRIPSRLFNRRTRRMGLSYSDAGCGMVAMESGIAHEALAYGDLRRSFRFKALLASLTTRLEEVPVRAGPPSPSSHHLADLLSAGLEVEVAFRRTVFLGVTAWGVAIAVACGAAALAAAVVGATGTASGWLGAGILAIAALLGAVLAAVGMAANLVLRSLHHQSTPFFRVAEVTPRRPVGDHP